MRPTLILFLALATAAAAQDTPASDPWLAGGRTEAQREALRGFLAKGMTRGEVGGGALLILHDGVVIFREGFGWADRENDMRFTPEHLCSIASMTKPTTATVLCMLAEQGKLSLDDPASKYIPAFGKMDIAGIAVRSPTIRELLSHTAGFPGNDKKEKVGEGPQLKDTVAKILAYGPVRRPGTKYAYCRFGFDVSARIAEIVSGKEWSALCQELLFAPLGMKRTTYRPNAEQRAGMPMYYVKRGSGSLKRYDRKRSDNPAPAYVSPGGGLNSTIDDMGRFFQMHLRKGLHGETRIASAATLAKMYRKQPATSGYGLGVSLRNKLVQHGGASGTLGWVDFDKKVVAILFTQTPRSSRNFKTAVQREVQALFGGKKSTATPEAAAKTAKEVFGRWDKNRDGVVSKSEMPRKRQRAFEMIDTDRSGGISLEELTRALQARAR